MSGVDKTKQNWEGLICPVCRFVFRIPINHSGNGVICPACSHLLQIPTVEQRQMYANVRLARASKSRSQQHSIKKRHGDVADTHLKKEETHDAEYEYEYEYEYADDELTTFKNSGQAIDQAVDDHYQMDGADPLPSWEHETAVAVPISPMTWMLSGSLLGVSIVLMAIWLVLQSADDQTNAALVDDGQTEFSVAADKTNFEEDDERQMIKKSKKIIEKFLNAKSVSELGELVRTPSVTIPRMRIWYQDDAWKAQGVRVIGYKKSAVVNEQVVTMDVQLNDFSVKTISVVKTELGYKVDWESWVAWSSVKWGDLFVMRPNQPVEVRVQCKRVNYYNRLFDNSNKWFAVRMSHPDFDRSIYGYVDSGAPHFFGFIAELLRGEEVLATLNISYPSNTSVGNQVTITEHLNSGWISDVPAETQAKQPASR